MTDIAVDPVSGRLFFGVGAATNSGVVGLDNWNWVQKYPDFCDLPAIKLLPAELKRVNCHCRVARLVEFENLHERASTFAHSRISFLPENA